MTELGDIVLEARGISRSFPGVKALLGVDLILRSGWLTALLCENGAGKSTLMNIVAGVLPPDQGDLLIAGSSVRFTSPRNVRDHGIAMIFQELSLVPDLTGAENIFPGREPLQRIGLIDYRTMNRNAAEWLPRMERDVSPTRPGDFLVNRVSFRARRGEVLGVFGLIGAGPTELLECLFGLPSGICKGEVFSGGRSVAIRSPRDAITRFKLPPFVAILVMFSIARGLTMLWTGGFPITGLGSTFDALGTGVFPGVPVPVWITGALVGVFVVLARKTRWGRYIYAVGGNERAALLTGLPVDRVKVAVYALGVMLSAVAGLIVTARLDSAQPNAGLGYELDSIAAVVIGGTSLSGGRGSVIGTVGACLIIDILINGLFLLNVSPFWQQVVKSFVIPAAVAIDRMN